MVEFFKIMYDLLLKLFKIYCYNYWKTEKKKKTSSKFNATKLLRGDAFLGSLTD
jgi:hypothetical protein